MQRAYSERIIVGSDTTCGGDEVGYQNMTLNLARDYRRCINSLKADKDPDRSTLLIKSAQELQIDCADKSVDSSSHDYTGGNDAFTVPILQESD